MNGVEVDLEVVQYFHSRATITFEPGDVIALKVTDGIPSGSLNIFAGKASSNPQGYFNQPERRDPG